MNTQTIPEGSWIEFADRFSRDHAGWLATVQVLDGRTRLNWSRRTCRCRGSASTPGESAPAHWRLVSATVPATT